MTTRDPDAMSAADTVPARRRFFATSAAAVAATAIGRSIEAQPPRGRPTPVPATRASDPSRQWSDPALRLVRRVTMGMTPDDVAEVRRLGYAAYLDQQLQPGAFDDSALESAIATRLPMMTWSLAQLRAQQATDNNELYNQLLDASWYRAAFAKAQLRERMVEFWSDHFTIYLQKVGYLKLVDDREVIRPYALGKFSDLLRATAHSGAMMRYLDQNVSTLRTPNQNYAREIMELHTMGSEGGYTQDDVAMLSRILTGWGTNADGSFAFFRANHDREEKTFLGRRFPAMAATATDAQLKGEGDAAIDMLLAHPSTAQYVSWKMARWLLAYDPPAAVVAATAATYTRTGGDIREMVRTILSSTNLMAAPAKYKRPFHLAISSMRALGLDLASVPNIRTLRQTSDRTMGMQLFNWEQPNGYPDSVEWWSGLVITRWNFAQTMASLASTTTARLDTMRFRTPDTPEGVVAQVGARLFGGEMPTALRTNLLTYLRGAAYSDTRVRETLSLALSAQEFQWY